MPTPSASSPGRAHQSHHATFGFWAAVACTVNYIVGAGFLSLPAVFAKAGLILSPIIVLMFGVLMDWTKDLMVEALGRAEVVSRCEVITRRHIADQPKESPETIASSSTGDGAVPVPTPSSSASSALVTPKLREYFVFVHRKFEVTDQLNMFIGKRAQVGYLVLLCLYMYGGLLSYATIAGASLTANVPLSFAGGGRVCDVQKEGTACLPAYRFFLACYAALVIPFSAMEIKEQLWMQAVMFAARIVIMVMLIATVAAGFSCDGVVFADVAPGSAGSGVGLATPAGLPSLLPTVIFAFIFHHSIPALSQPVADKGSLRRVFRAAFLIVGSCYVGIGVAVAAFFGNRVDSQCNLNWSGYVGCMARPAAWGNATATGEAAPACSDADSWSAGCIDVSARSGLATAIAYIVLLFPALDVLSAFPLNALTLGNNLMSAILGEAALAPPPAEEEAAFWASEASQAAVAARSGFYRWLFIGKQPQPKAQGGKLSSPAPSPAPRLHLQLPAAADSRASGPVVVPAAALDATAADAAVGIPDATTATAVAAAADAATSGTAGGSFRAAAATLRRVLSGGGVTGSGAAAAARRPSDAQPFLSEAATDAGAAPGSEPAGSVVPAVDVAALVLPPAGAGPTSASAAGGSAASPALATTTAPAPAMSGGAGGSGSGSGMRPLHISAKEYGSGSGMRPLHMSAKEYGSVFSISPSVAGDDSHESHETRESRESRGAGHSAAAARSASSRSRSARRAGASAAALESIRGEGEADSVSTGSLDDEDEDGVPVGGPLGAATPARDRSTRPLHLRTARGHRVVTVGFRMAAALPPLVAAFFVDNLGNVLEATGLIGVGIALVVPALLSLYSFAKERAVFTSLSAAIARRRAAIDAADAGEAAAGTAAAATSASAAGRGDAVVAAAAASLPSVVQSSQAVDAALNAPDPAAGAVTPTGATAGDHLQGAARAAVAGTNIAFCEATAKRASVDAAFANTPYTPWFKPRYGAEGLLALSAVLSVFVGVMIVRTYVNGS